MSLKRWLAERKMRKYFGDEHKYLAQFKDDNDDDVITDVQMEEQAGKGWYLDKINGQPTNQTFITASLIHYGVMKTAPEITFWLNVSYKNFQKIMAKHAVDKNYHPTVTVYKVMQGLYPKLVKTDILLDLITDYRQNTSMVNTFKRIEDKRETYANYKKQIDAGNIKLSSKAQSKVKKELKHYDDYLNKLYVYKGYYMPDQYRLLGFPSNKYACLTVTDIFGKVKDAK